MKSEKSEDSESEVSEEQEKEKQDLIWTAVKSLEFRRQPIIDEAIVVKLQIDSFYAPISDHLR
jgi:hypothetical protein